MNSTRKLAALTGILFIIGTATGVTAATISKPFLSAPDALIITAGHEGEMLIISMLALAMGLACAGIGLTLYPILKQYNEGLAIGATGFRLMEGMLEIVAAANLIGLLALSQEAAKGGAALPALQALWAVLNASNDWLNNVAVLVCWCTGALLYYSLFYQMRLIPRWLSVWGLAGISLTILGCILVNAHLVSAFGTFQVISNVPIALQEMVFAVWLIVKGVASPSIHAKNLTAAAPVSL